MMHVHSHPRVLSEARSFHFHDIHGTKLLTVTVYSRSYSIMPMKSSFHVCLFFSHKDIDEAEAPTHARQMFYP